MHTQKKHTKARSYPVKDNQAYLRAIDEIRKLSSRMICVTYPSRGRVDYERVQQINEIFDWDIRVVTSELASQFSEVELVGLISQLELLADAIAVSRKPLVITKLSGARTIPYTVSDGFKTVDVLAGLIKDAERS